jgi:hypothetical protein
MEVPQDNVKADVVAPYIPHICCKKVEAGNKTVKGFQNDEVDDLFASNLIVGYRFVVPFGGSKIILKYKAANKVVIGEIPYIKSYGERVMRVRNQIMKIWSRHL